MECTEVSRATTGSKFCRKLVKTIMKSHRVRLPRSDLPVRLRPWFLVFTCVVMLLLAVLGYMHSSRSLPLNGKLLHFFCFCIATGVFYFIFDVEEQYRRIWFWRHAGLIFTSFICMFCGGFLSELIQSMFPYREFVFGNVVANLAGGAVGLTLAFYLEKYYRYRREIARLYRPLNTDFEYEEDEDEMAGPLLPTVELRASKPGQSAPTKTNGPRLADVWDEREELFGVGSLSDDEDEGGPPLSSATHAQLSQPRPPIPKILVNGD
ncbi:hypothetical protein FISHEDRAFT_51643 [Fistulina hepatica ATCC 64428]|uniref:VanZ-like domain-containing protein n=1 Tax=Fistulina hepatica ATCC 64428 TaxID=1128425 RepID=A0A0D7A232_9AGAR|nr:hypothetical protein FISHEDRAFT_51643 [Fistulina hepatica ATCC 64428]